MPTLEQKIMASGKIPAGDFPISPNKAQRRILKRYGVDLETASDVELMAISIDQHAYALNTDKNIAKLRADGELTVHRLAASKASSALARATAREIERILLMRYQDKKALEAQHRNDHLTLQRSRKNSAAWCFMVATMSLLGREQCQALWNAAKEKFPDGECWGELPQPEAVEMSVAKHLEQLRKDAKFLAKQFRDAEQSGALIH